MIIEISMWL